MKNTDIKARRLVLILRHIMTILNDSRDSPNPAEVSLWTAEELRHLVQLLPEFRKVSITDAENLLDTLSLIGRRAAAKPPLSESEPDLPEMVTHAWGLCF